jgi:hypothetical protein
MFSISARADHPEPADSEVWAWRENPRKVRMGLLTRKVKHVHPARMILELGYHPLLLQIRNQRLGHARSNHRVKLRTCDVSENGIAVRWTS